MILIESKSIYCLLLPLWIFISKRYIKSNLVNIQSDVINIRYLNKLYFASIPMEKSWLNFLSNLITLFLYANIRTLLLKLILRVESILQRINLINLLIYFIQTLFLSEWISNNILYQNVINKKKTQEDKKNSMNRIIEINQSR